ncbi:MAG: ATP-binding protein [Bacteroidia bacterium]|jgi:PAS domain S-box-containing protein|nr:ATP-binding protein [Bacteroidia bacterium]
MNVTGPGSVFLINALLLILLALYFDKRKREPLGEILWWLMLAAGWWSLLYGLELILQSKRLIHLLFSLEYPAVMTLPVFWLIFIIRLSKSDFLSKRNTGWLFLVPAANWLMLLTNPTHKLFYTNAVINTSSGISYITFDPGPIYTISHLTYSNAVVAAGMILLIRMIALSKGMSRGKAVFLLFSATFPFMLSLLWIFGIRPYGILDFTPLGFTVMGIVLAALYSNISEMELRPFVLDSLFEYQSDAVMVTDFEGKRLLYANTQGQMLLEGLKENKGLDFGIKRLMELQNHQNFSFGGKHYQVLIQELDESKAGTYLKLYIFHDVSALKLHESNLSALTKTITTFGNDTNVNIGKLLALLGEIFGADACFYNKKIGSMLITTASWNAPPGYQEADRAEGHICNDVIQQSRSVATFINELQNTDYLSSDPNVRRYGLNTYLGVPVFQEGKPVATVCMVFTQNRSFSDSELQLLNLVSFVVSNEEARKQQLQKINETEINFRAILENSLDSIWSVDTEFCVTYVNETFKTAYKAAFNVDLEEGICIIDTLPKSLRPVWRSRYEKALKGEHYIFLDSVPLSDDITLFIEVSVMPIIVDGRTTGISFYGRNITEKYLAEQRLLQSEKRLSELNAAKDRVFSVISHDLRSPFNNIIGLSEVIEGLAEEQGNQTIKEYASSILRVSKNTFVVLENLLHWSRVQSGKLKLHADVVRLSEVVAGELEFQQYRVEQKLIKITNQVDASHAVVADAQSVAVIVRNLVSNAIKFSYSEGEIVLKSELQNDNVYFAVQDFGCGISIEDQKALFQLDKHPTRRGTQNETGTGLGLILSKELAEKNEGHLLVHSRTGQGSTFTLVLKAAQKAFS